MSQPQHSGQSPQSAALNQEQHAVERKIDEYFAMLLVKLPP